MARTKFLKKKIVPFDPLACNSTNDTVSSLRHCSFQGRSLAYALDVWEAMCRDKKCVRVMSLAGAMVPAGMGLVIIRLIEEGLVDAIVCTGATMAHDMCNSVAANDQAHYIGDEFEDDILLREKAINRIYDTYLSEHDFQRAEKVLVKLMPRLHYHRATNGVNTISTNSFLRQLGRRLKGASILTTAAKHGVQLFVPGIADSELGLNVLVGNKVGAVGRGRHVVFDTLRDIDLFAALLLKHSRAGLVSVGGGVPRNWAQQVYPYLNMKVMDRRVKAEGYHYGVRITTDRPEFGGLSGCTISESKSWGKYESRAIEASVICDATIALPVLATALFERLGIGKRA